MIGIIAGWLVKRSLAKGGALTLPYARKLAKVGLIAAAGVLLIASLFLLDWWDDKAAVEQANARATVEAVTKAREADAAADSANDRTRNEVEQANDEARQAADSSADPLAAGLRSLRD